ncbi:MAG: bifunctional phosphoglucose/phosphomannose isomerase [Candidatus Staskawiczbacteria bacterium RIFCSPLOWO2_01_FULL_38_12b]|uniref:Bifunctional phosphoglucose/phosphomannose isomerase n=1 Tax=Candidatus Staskawiczbacteria bacterium RIFCSPLOWO2_01_FULL_38_12b TaxID=1802214 RepID=A0A1G2ICC9_9BACT|nr:MAG: bifunctional phosphoglucose/phosphomannose isomerase [Candidatus Staskawiczbacteria bacterium RIFCSPLOWO2_01_FULL_38_12b]
MEISNTDKSNMKQVIIDSPLQIKDGLDLAKNINIENNFSNVIICGIGGSALPGDILNTIVNAPIPISLHRSYNLPTQANEKSLVICISYSGNTEEPLSALQEAITRKLPIICMASGGQIEMLCLKNNIPFVKIPSGIQPRSATGYIFSALVKILANAKIIDDMSSEILRTSKQLQEINTSLENEGNKLAKKLSKKIPVIYSSDSLKNLAMVWKIKFNENSKIPAFYNYFPELNHNEMVGYTGLKKLGIKNFFVIILQDKSEHPRILKRMELTTNIIKKSGAKVEIIGIKDGSPLFKIFSSLLLGDWVSYYLAMENDTDPTPVSMVEEFKKLMQ